MAVRIHPWIKEEQERVNEAAKRLMKKQLKEPCRSPVHLARWSVYFKNGLYELQCSYGRKLN